MEILKQLACGELDQATATAIEFGWLDEEGGAPKSNRERIEFEVKLNAIGMFPPWQQKQI
jgi:hypothetical protein